MASSFSENFSPTDKLFKHSKARIKPTAKTSADSLIYGKFEREEFVFHPGKIIPKDANGVPLRFQLGKPFCLEDQLGGRKKIPDVLARRNGIPAAREGDKLFSAAEFDLKFFKNKHWGGGYIPGSNFGFARATQTTKESRKVFGKSLAQLWKKSPEIPEIVLRCLNYLRKPEHLRYDKWCCDQELSRGEHGSDLRREVKLLKYKFNTGIPQGPSVLDQVSQPKAVFDLFLLFLKELNPPLLTFKLYDKFIDSQMFDLERERVDALKPVVAQLPPANETVLGAVVAYLVELLSKKYRVYNGLTRETVAQWFGPLLLREDPLKPKRGLSADGQVERMLACQVMKIMLKYPRELFSPSLLSSSADMPENIPFPLQRHIQTMLDDIETVAELESWTAPGEETNTTDSLSGGSTLEVKDAEECIIQQYSKKLDGIIEELQVDQNARNIAR